MGAMTSVIAGDWPARARRKWIATGTKALAVVWLFFAPGLAHADPTLRGRVVTFSVLAYDDPAHPMYQGKGLTVQVGDGVEFGLGQEGPQNGIDVAPVRVDIGPSRIEVSALAPETWLLSAAFNGYVLAFETECALFEQAAVDRDFSTLQLAPDAISTKGGKLFINVEGLHYTAESRFAIDLQVADCPLS